MENRPTYFDDGCGRCARFQTDDCSARQWSLGLEILRDICLAQELQETIKWSHPCYTYSDRNIAILGAFRTDFRITFMNAELLSDKAGVLVRAGDQSQVANVLKFTSQDDVVRAAPSITEFLFQLKERAASGVKTQRKVTPVEIPDVLLSVLHDDPELRAAFDKLTPGRQKSYAILVNSAKRHETKIARISKSRDKILQGKGALDR
jgi:uncharacterized protein YdeI (YjbR/CyaY-like superfamily)